MSRGISFELKFQVRFSNVSVAAAGTPFARFCNIQNATWLKRYMRSVTYTLVRLWQLCWSIIVPVDVNVCAVAVTREIHHEVMNGTMKNHCPSRIHPPISLAEMMYRAKAIKKKKNYCTRIRIINRHSGSKYYDVFRWRRPWVVSHTI